MPETLLRFIHISDTHYAPPDYERPTSRIDPRQGVRVLIQQLNALPFTPDFILHTGDVAYDPYPEIYDEIRTIFAELKVPVRYVPGNHDHNGALQTVVMGRAEPQIPYYAKEVLNDVRLLYLDSNDFAAAPPPAGYVSEAQIAWLRDELAADDPRPVVVAVHHPLQKTGSNEWFDVFMNTVNGDAVHEVLKTAADKVRGVFYGHVHQNISFLRDGVLYCSALSSWTQFRAWPGQDMETIHDLSSDPGYNLVTITREGTIIQQIRYKVE